MPLVAAGGLAVSAQSFFNTVNGKLPVIDGVAVTPFDATAKNTVILYGDSAHVLGPIGSYATEVLQAKTAVVAYPQTADIAPGAAAIQAALKAAGVQVTMAPYPAGDTNLAPVLTDAHAATADMVVPYTDAAGCAPLARALTQQHLTDPKKIVSAAQCLSGTVPAGLGDYPRWTYSIARPLYGDPTDPGMSDYVAVTRQYISQADAPNPWELTGFGELLTVAKILNQVGYANLSPAAVTTAARGFQGPQLLGSPLLACGQFAAAPAVCNTEAQFFEYDGDKMFTKMAGWTSPPATAGGKTSVRPG